MLAKQGWRIVTNPSSLIAKLYKARYFPNYDFWQAELGDALSFSWRSILAGRPVLKAGTRWRIGDGTKINIWNESWIPNWSPSLVQRPTHSPVEMVSDLINASTKQWIPPIIHGIFQPSVAAKILSIPLAHQNRLDKHYWYPDRRGWYTIKSAYWLAWQQVLGNALPSSSNGDPFKELWRKLWKARVPGKVQICAWRACCNLLPTRERLTTKGYEGDLHCLLCHYAVEDSSHLFCTCPTATRLLSQAPFHLQNSLLPNINFKEWLLERAMHLKMEVFEKLLMLIWGLWKNRNSKLWENKANSASDIFLRCMTWLDEFHQAKKSDTAPQVPVSKRWNPASTATLTWNVDGAFLPQFTKGGLGGVLRNARGEVQAAFQAAVPFVSSPIHVELLAIQSGLQLVRLHKFQSVCIVSDCLLAVQDINGRSPILSEYGPLIEDIQLMIQQLHPIQVSYVPRACNRLAHRLASLAYESEQSVCWLHTTPDCIRDIVQEELPPPT